MKCPKCGFVSYPGIEQCKKCGHRFVAAESQKSSSGLLSILPPVPPRPKAAPSKPASPAPSTTPEPEPAALVEAEPVEPPEVPSEPAAEQGSQVPWRAELNDRLEDFRRKRGRLQGQFDPGTSLDLEFGTPADEGAANPVDAPVSEPSREPGGFDVALTPPQREMPVLESVPLEKSGEDLRVLSSAAVEAGEKRLHPDETETEPVEIILESSPPPAHPAMPRAMPGTLRVASLGPRFIAGLGDALVLLLGAGLFALIFWAAGGHLSLRPLNIVILGAITVLFVVSYFGLFTALSSSTPGLLWMNLEVRSLDGGPPTPQESFWRAFGYLVSIASLLLGFVWALVDGDHLTWHDHMSGTFISPIGG